MAAVLKERDDGTTRASIRSNPGVDVASIARKFGGGGHPRRQEPLSPQSVPKPTGSLLKPARLSLIME